MSKIFVLGKSSFIGYKFFSFIRDKENCFLISRKEIDFLNPTTFSSLNFNDSIIVDFINVNNGNEKEIIECNNSGFFDFINYLKKNALNFRYVYISTISVCSNEHIKSSVYVRSKKIAEDFIINSGIDFQIFRLSYPIGKGENKQRLVSNLIRKLKCDEEIFINNYLVNLNDVGEVVSSIYSNLLMNKTQFISNNVYLSLEEVVLFLKDTLNSSSKVIVKNVDFQFTPQSDKPYKQTKSIKETLKEMI